MVRSLRLSLLLVAGCAGLLGDVEPPEVSLAGMAFDQPGLFEQRLSLDVRLRNPNDFPLDVERLLFDIEINDRDLGRGWTVAPFEVPAFGEAVVPVSLVVPTSDLIARILELGTTQRLDYRLSGQAKLRNATLGTVPFERDGNFALPGIPKASPPRT
jgi:LEA14-like dessication related protein